jgi:ADP-ribose pyrophosphatase YjhB (NUDIX family)
MQVKAEQQRQKVCVAIFAFASPGDLLLQIRDNDPTIAYPGHLSLLGGLSDLGETPAAAATREMGEEVSLPGEFTVPLSIGSQNRRDAETLECYYLTATMEKSTRVRILEGVGLLRWNSLHTPKCIPMAPHHAEALRLLREQILSVPTRDTIERNSKMGIDDHFSLSQLSPTNDIDAMCAAGGFVGKAAGPIGAFMPARGARFIALLEFAVNVPRGDHYHFRKIENIVILQGDVKCDLWLVEQPEERTTLTLHVGDRISIDPKCVHTYTALGNLPAIALEYAAEPFALDDTVVLSQPK